MSTPLDQLSEEEVNFLAKCPAVVTVLIAGADQHIDNSEKNWATKLVHYRTFTSDPLLNEYYRRVEEHFEENLSELLEKWDPSNAEESLSQELANAKPILEKLDDEYAEMIRKSWRSLAKKVAEASGGLLGFGSINAAEEHLIDLPMLS